jgi:two-component sensor histidine kinase
MSEYLGRLMEQLIAAYGAEGRIRQYVDVQSIMLSVNAAIPCGLIMNELITNAFKYAYPDGREGELRVSLRGGPDGVLELRTRDDGVGLPVGYESRASASLGLTLVRLLVDQLHGELQVSGEGGADFRIRFRDAPGDTGARGA